MALARPRPLACTLLVVASCLVALPALADPKAPAPDAKPAAEKSETSDAKSQAEPAAKPAKAVRRVNKKEGMKVVAKAKDPTAKDAAPASVDVGDTPITARSQTPIVQVVLEKTPVVFSLHELAGPYREADAFKAP